MTNRKQSENKPKTKRRLSTAALTARAKFLEGKSPRERGIEKTRAGLLWVQKWGWSSSKILDALVGTSGGNSLGSRLVKNKWLKRTPIRIVSGYKSAPSDILMITPIGHAELIALAGDANVRDVPTMKNVETAHVTHDSLAQRLTLQVMSKIPSSAFSDSFQQEHGKLVAMRTARELSAPLTGGEKYPDVVWTFKDECGAQCNFDVEVELSPKWGRELDQFIAGHIERQTSGNTYGLLVFFASAAARDRYTQAMQPRMRVRKWFWSDQARRWTPGENAIDHHWITIPDDFWLRTEMVPAGF